jgi:preprotein translocase subunit SecA
MFGRIAKALFGSANDRFVKSLGPIVAAVNALEDEAKKLSDDALRARTDAFRKRLADGETIEDLLPEAFATVREAARRALGERHYDVQIIGGVVLHRGMIAEMKTGEGKTLVATLPVYLNALEGKGVHVVTVNDYLARRDSEWMGRVYKFLGLSVGCIVHELNDEQRRAAYAADITYGTNNEFGFDYLRDNMKYALADMVQRPFNYAIVDEVDSILIDEARTPLIISGPAEDSSELYRKVNALIPALKPEHYDKDEKNRSVALSESGQEAVDGLLREAGLLEAEASLYDHGNIALVHHVNQALRAHKLFTKDVDYIVRNGGVVIIDEFTGRMMEGRRYSDGLHQALEAKEGVRIQQENQTLASITFQNYFRLYPKLAGMTGTAMTEAPEFHQIYKLAAAEIPTNMKVARVDQDDEVYRSGDERDEAVIRLIEENHKRGQPMLVGTVSIEKSETLAEKLKKKGVPHEVLNARNHEREAMIIAQAGKPGAVTIATNMAGRGTDIKLGGNFDARVLQELADVPEGPERERRKAEIRAEIEAAKQKVIASGGLFVIGTERHESRRIDNQLRGRSGRQGDPGNSRFFISLQDDLMRIFGSQRLDGWLQRLGLKPGEAIIHPWINKALEKAQRKVEERNFEIRKNLLRFDDVMNDQRKVIYEQRIELMRREDVSDMVADMRNEVVEGLVSSHIPAGTYAEQWNAAGLEERVKAIFNLDLPVKDWAAEEGIADEEIVDRLKKAVDEAAAQKVAKYGADVFRAVEKSILLQILDQNWKDHLHTLDYLRQAVNLRAYGQKDPLTEYKKEAFDLFHEMLGSLRENLCRFLAHVEIQMGGDENAAALAERPLETDRAVAQHAEAPALAATGTYGMGWGDPAPVPSGEAGGNGARPLRTRSRAGGVDPNDPGTWGRTPRNAACPCGSGKKYKHCHGAVA